MTASCPLCVALPATSTVAADRMPDRTIAGYVKSYDDVRVNGWTFTRVRPMGDDELWLNHTVAVNHASDAVWLVRVAATPRYGQTASSLKTVIWASPMESANRSIPMELHHGDVLPSLVEGDVVTARVTLLADTVEYASGDAPDELLLSAPDPIRPLREERNLDVDNPALVCVDGTIRDVTWLQGAAEGEMTCVVELLTRMGPLPVVHRWDALPPDVQETVRPGNLVTVTGVLVGDVAVKEYAQGARFDAVHALRVLKDAIATQRGSRGVAVLAPDCTLAVGPQTVEIPNHATRPAALMRHLARLLAHGTLSYAHVTTDTQGTPLEHSEPCLVHATPNGKPDALVRVTLNAADRVAQVTVETTPDACQWVLCTDSRRFALYDVLHRKARLAAERQ